MFSSDRKVHTHCTCIVHKTGQCMSFAYMLFFQQTYLSPGSLSYLPISLPLYCTAAHFTSIPYNSLSGVDLFYRCTGDQPSAMPCSISSLV